jgi:hypothetical protein
MAQNNDFSQFLKIRKSFVETLVINSKILSYEIPNLYEDDPSISNFRMMINKLGYDTINNFLKDVENWILVYHGCPEINAIRNICSKSWNVNFAGIHGEDYGKGIYFSDTFKSAYNYSKRGDSIGGVIPTIIINPKKYKNICVNIIKKTKNEIWYMSEKSDFCLPLAIFHS